MLKKPMGYDSQQAYTGEFEALPAGGYVCRILGVRLEQIGAGTRMIVMLDIAEGEFAGFFQSQYDRRRASDAKAKWSGSALLYLTLPASLSEDKYRTMLGFFKGFLGAVATSNPQWVNTFETSETLNEQTLKGLMVGMLFRREEFEATNGERKWAVKCTQARSVQAIRSGDFKVPEDKPLKAAKSAGRIPNWASGINASGIDIEVVDENDLPF